MLRFVILLGLLGAAVAVPYSMTKTSSTDWGARLKSLWPAGGGDSSPSIAAFGASSIEAEIPAARSPDGPGSLLFPSKVPIEGARAQRLEEVFRMDVTKEWVYGRWSRKSTAVAHPEWFGVRVPLVTGTRIDDLAGSLTYYFDQIGRVQHISFRGKTGDTTRLVGLLFHYYQFARQIPEIPGEQLYQVRFGNQVQSELRTQTAPILWTSSPHSSFSVELELARPGSNRALPPRRLVAAAGDPIPPGNVGPPAAR